MAEKQPREHICIVHTEGITNPGKLTLISELKDPDARFKVICDTKVRRLQAPANSLERREYSCSLVPNVLQDHHGYQRSCYQRYTNHLDKIPMRDLSGGGTQKEAHKNALQKVVAFIDDSIIAQHQVIQLSQLRLLYTSELDQTSFANPSYRAEKLKDKLSKHHTVGSKLAFTLVQTSSGTLPFYLVFCSAIKTADAISRAYELA